MVRLNKIYTRTGDDGTTGLAGGARVQKHGVRVTAFGLVDEVNAAIGIVRLHTAKPGYADYDSMLARIQNDLFDLGADLARPPEDGNNDGLLRISEKQVARLEKEIDTMNATLKPLESFILPGGNEAAAHIHDARTRCRTAERAITRLAAEEKVGETAIRFINRLSDHLFVMARAINDGGDILWQPGENL